ncbi:hypothetical protein J2Y38_002598 [Flavobacterium sp. 2755]|uniref:hypothetical protein n=1 Tax=Flavobacterium sp. 2755 TaxID=2817765 RepID=UPI002861E527|nr:hypothetical protein [Flavobacterium sp. 2755]MDR6762387.1 hypothetical protein [Flavobacterium sp. 2755]
MIKKLLKIIFVLMLSNSIYAQETNETSNPIIYFEGFGGPTIGQSVGISGGLELNYQTGENLFTFRFTNAVGYSERSDNYIIMPRYYKSEDNKEYAFLYGRRWLSSNHSYSVSVGVSRNNLEMKKLVESIDHEEFESEEVFSAKSISYYGVPFEANYKWFYSKKKSRLIYNAIIPSVGVKLFGNFGKYTFIGAGVTVGFGLSKKY